MAATKRHAAVGRAMDTMITVSRPTSGAPGRAAARAHAELADASWTTTGVSGGAHEEGIGRLHWRGDGANKQNGGNHFRRR
uniref:Uncharacterized protein n=1 Tax=Candidatus Kentrum sp. TUN TaxID=2126343 RepID=A0A451A9P9_9GAMM|nr:MAG: hypothetical protein BECKTUN1418F_GA0071002_10889 [Candidatus Kentron sp. TUN]VFK59045.1 MAG: hypothetical protein BECKTUN1418D_GA0071000_109417 [Candidatus Kentron sp. TUN]VFK62776.1 MAG: hypothetical protein BECKTUN1418E_GA0071001_108610 [Candidatus Kentron sp. TUN]